VCVRYTIEKSFLEKEIAEASYFLCDGGIVMLLQIAAKSDESSD